VKGDDSHRLEGVSKRVCKSQIQGEVTERIDKTRVLKKQNVELRRREPMDTAWKETTATD